MIHGTPMPYVVYEPSGTNRYIGGLNAGTLRNSLVHEYCTTPISSQTNGFEEFDDDPLTPEELDDLEISYRELREGKAIILSEDMSDEEFFANL